MIWIYLSEPAGAVARAVGGAVAPGGSVLQGGQGGVGVLGNVQQPHEQLQTDLADGLGLHGHIHLDAHPAVVLQHELGEAVVPVEPVAQAQGLVLLALGDLEKLEGPDGGVVVGPGDEKDLQVVACFHVEAGDDRRAVLPLLNIAGPVLALDGGLNVLTCLKNHGKIPPIRQK